MVYRQRELDTVTKVFETSNNLRQRQMVWFSEATGCLGAVQPNYTSFIYLVHEMVMEYS